MLPFVLEATHAFEKMGENIATFIGGRSQMVFGQGRIEGQKQSWMREIKIDTTNHRTSNQITSLCEGSSEAANFRGQIDHFTESFSHSAEDAVCGKLVKSSRYRFSPNLV